MLTSIVLSLLVQFGKFNWRDKWNQGHIFVSIGVMSNDSTNLSFAISMDNKDSLWNAYLPNMWTEFVTHLIAWFALVPKQHQVGSLKTWIK